MTRSLFSIAMENQDRQHDMVAGLKALIGAYYDDYTDADELDVDFWLALHRVYDDYLEQDLDMVIDDLQDEITAETGRPFARSRVSP